MKKKKPTIRELEKILNGPPCKIRILPNGELKHEGEDMGTISDELRELAAMLDKDFKGNSVAVAKRLWITISSLIF